MSVAVIAGYLAFFPVAVEMVRGLKSATAVHLDYFRCSAASWWRTLSRLKLPSSLPYLVPSLRLVAAAAVVGTIGAEISTGLEGGIGRLIITYAQPATGDPSRMYAAVLGLAAAAVVSLADIALWRYAPGGGGLMAGTTPPAVEIRGVRQTFTVRRGSVVALEDIDLTVAPGEFVSLIGPSGCGKSTLLRIVADLLTPTRGTVEVGGKTAHRARLDQDYGFASQQAGLLDWRTVRANVELPLELHGVDRATRRARALELLELVGLSDFAGHRPPQLSGGM